MNTLIMLSLAVTLGVLLGAIFTARVMSKVIDDRLASRDQMWEQALKVSGSAADRALPVWNEYADGDPFDHFPWTWSAYVDDDGNRSDLGSICTPNGRRPDGTSHTYWMIAGSIWLPAGIIICEAVNAEAHRRYGTPIHDSVIAS